VAGRPSRRLHVVRVDLTSAEIQLVATPELPRQDHDRGRARSAVVKSTAARSAASARLAMGGAVWAGTADDGTSGFLAFARVGERSTASICRRPTWSRPRISIRDPGRDRRAAAPALRRPAADDVRLQRRRRQ
jgi:hypothetical protein